MSRISLICYNCFLTVLFSTRTTTVGLYTDLLRKLIIYVLLKVVQEQAYVMHLLAICKKCNRGAVI